MATWTTPIEWEVDQLVSAADLNEQVSGNMEFLLDRPVGEYILVRDEKTQNTAGGTFTSGAWRTRDLNTEVTDDGNHATLSSNQITLAAGTYAFRISAPAWNTAGNHQTRLQNISDTTTVALGTCDSTNARSVVSGVFTIADTKVFEVQHRSTGTQTTSGFGVACNFNTEVYTVAEFWKVK